MSFKEFLNFFRLVDDTGLLSLTQILVWVMIIKIACEPTVDLASAAALFTAISAYHFKRYLLHKNTQRKDEAGTAIDKNILAIIKDDISKLKLHAGIRSKNENPLGS